MTTTEEHVRYSPSPKRLRRSLSLGLCPMARGLLSRGDLPRPSPCNAGLLLVLPEAVVSSDLRREPERA